MRRIKRPQAVFLDRDGVIIREVNYLTHPDQLKLIKGSAEAIKELRAAGFKVIVITNQSAVARGFITIPQLGTIHKKLGELLRRHGARLDAIYYCPHHPRAGRRVNCACRKPKTLMIKRAAKKFKLDLRNSYFVGDTTTDMLTAKNAGCRALLVRTGKAGKDGNYKVKAEAAFRNLASAAKRIINEQ